MLDHGTVTKENPDALAGAVGADVQGTTIDQNATSELPAYATAFIDAVLALPQEDRMPLLELVIHHFRAGPPIPPLINYADEAYFWSDIATRSELKAYLWACWTRLKEPDRSRFLALVGQGKAAA